jgi:hypothetical protein
MRATRCLTGFRTLLTLAAATAAAALATAPSASAFERIPSPGSSQVCIGVQGGFLLQINGFGSMYPPNTAVSTTLTFVNGKVVTLDATTTDEGIFHTATFTLDMRDPEEAALVGTYVQHATRFEGGEASFSWQVVGCPTAPDGRAACLDGGFESYPALAFLNQGDCVSWIATRGKNEPGQNAP